MAYGLGNYIYETEMIDSGVKFRFVDPDDPSNSAEATVKTNEVDASPEGREAAEIAFAQVRAGMDAKRLERIQKEEEAELQANHDREQKEVAAREDFFNSTEDVTVRPHHVEEDGTRVYNDQVPNNRQSNDNDKKKKK